MLRYNVQPSNINYFFVNIERSVFLKFLTSYANKKVYVTVKQLLDGKSYIWLTFLFKRFRINEGKNKRSRKRISS